MARAPTTKSREKKAWMEIKVAVDDPRTHKFKAQPIIAGRVFCAEYWSQIFRSNTDFSFLFFFKTTHFNPIAFAGFVWFQSPSGSHCGLQSELSRPGFSSAVKRERRREADQETERVIRGYFHVLFLISFVLILVQIHSVWLCVSRGLPLRSRHDSLASFFPPCYHFYHVSDVDSVFDSVILDCACFWS